MMSSEKLSYFTNNQSDDENATEDDILLLCNLLEEYKDLSDKRLLENQHLVEYINNITNENKQLQGINQSKNEKIYNLETSMNELLEEIENMNKVIISKESDLQSLHHCLNLVHRRKVEVDDQTQIEQSRMIQKLFTEKESIQKNYSENLKTLEYYLDIINNKESEIMELKLLIKTNENHISRSSEVGENHHHHLNNNKDNSNHSNFEDEINLSYINNESLNIISPESNNSNNINPTTTNNKSSNNNKYKNNYMPPPTSTPPKRLTMNIKSFMERNTTHLKDQSLIDDLSNTSTNNNNNDNTSIFLSMNNNNGEDNDDEDDEELSPVAITINRNYINRRSRNTTIHYNTIRQQTTNQDDISFTSISSKRNSPTTIVDNTQQNLILDTFQHPQSSSSSLGNKKRDTMFYSQHNYKSKQYPSNVCYNNQNNHHVEQQQRNPSNTTATSVISKSWKDIKKHEKLFSDNTPIFKYPSNNNDVESDRI